MLAWVIPGKKYRNIKTKDIYEVLNIGFAAWDNEQHLVVYKEAGVHWSLTWVRSLNEFKGKFEEVENDSI
jgi:hypothetical protein